MVVMCIWQRLDKTDAFAREEWRKQSIDNFNLRHLMHTVLLITSRRHGCIENI